MARRGIKQMIRDLFKKEPRTPREMKYYLKYGDEGFWHQKCYPHKYTNSSGAR